MDISSVRLKSNGQAGTRTDLRPGCPQSGHKMRSQVPRGPARARNQRQGRHVGQRCSLFLQIHLHPCIQQSFFKRGGVLTDRCARRSISGKATSERTYGGLKYVHKSLLFFPQETELNFPPFQCGLGLVTQFEQVECARNDGI